MKYLLVPDKFKGSATAKEVVAALIQGISMVDPHASFHQIIASDGGDGFLDTVSHYAIVEEVHLKSFNAKGQPIDSYYLNDKALKTAYIELANTAGLSLLKNQELNILETSTFGMGIQIKHAIDNGAKHIYLGLGGSATNDAGLGIMEALEFEFYNKKEERIKICSGILNEISSITLKDYAHINFHAVNDVDNPLFGINGAAHVFAPQKGAVQEEVELLENGLQHLATLLKISYNNDLANIKGSGAAGGTAYGLKTFLDATFINGFEFLAKLSGLKEEINHGHYDYLITGEGQFDSQSLEGKLIDGILGLTTKQELKTLIICGSNTVDEKTIVNYAIHAILPIKKEGRSLEYCLNHTTELITQEIKTYFKNH